MQTLDGTKLQHYLITGHLARGGMSDIYLARDIYTDETVAIKLVHNSNSEYYERFCREAQVIAALQHEHILPAYCHGAYESWYYMVTPYVQHGTLKDRLERGPLSLSEADTILQQLVSALQYAHDLGIIHRDIKPSNILMRNDESLYLADFGLVRRVGEETGLTVTGYIIGTPEYMAPELAEEDATASSDIYALGVVLYQMVTGQVPFKGTTPMGIYLKHIRERPQAPSTINPAIPTVVDEIILRALEKEPRHRFSSARELAEAYHHAVKGVQKQDLPAPEKSTDVNLAILTAMKTIPLVWKNDRYIPRSAIVAAAALFFVFIPLAMGAAFYSANRLNTGLSPFQGADFLGKYWHIGSTPTPTPTVNPPPANKQPTPGTHPVNTTSANGTRHPAKSSGNTTGNGHSKEENHNNGHGNTSHDHGGGGKGGKDGGGNHDKKKEASAGHGSNHHAGGGKKGKK